MKIEVDITDNEYKFLKQYAEVYGKEREIDYTADPIVLVQDRFKEYTNPDYYFTGLDYELAINGYDVTVDGLITSFEELTINIRDILREHKFTGKYITDIIDDITFKLYGLDSQDEFIENYDDVEIYIKKHYYKYKYKTVAYFLTRAEAEKYLQYQGHNLHHPRVYTSYSGYDNRGDYPALTKLLLKIGKMLEEI